jgi:hypothetical protein
MGSNNGEREKKKDQAKFKTSLLEILEIMDKIFHNIFYKRAIISIHHLFKKNNLFQNLSQKYLKFSLDNALPLFPAGGRGRGEGATKC